MKIWILNYSIRFWLECWSHISIVHHIWINDNRNEATNVASIIKVVLQVFHRSCELLFQACWVYRPLICSCATTQRWLSLLLPMEIRAAYLLMPSDHAMGLANAGNRLWLRIRNRAPLISRWAPMHLIDKLQVLCWWGSHRVQASVQ